MNTIPALSPRDYFTRIGRMPDFIKTDIERAEAEVIASIKSSSAIQITSLPELGRHD